MILRQSVLPALGMVLLLLVFAGLSDGAETLDGTTVGVSFSPDEIGLILQFRRGDVPADPTNRFADDPAAARLGQRLFFDTRFSSDGKISCATCHDPSKGFADGKQLGEGLSVLTRHTPTVWNAALHPWQFWDGRADTLWAQALQPMENDKEMGSNRVSIAHAIWQDDQLRQEYEHLFGLMPALGDASRFPPAGKPVPDNNAHPLHTAWMSMDAADRFAVNTVFTNVGKAIEAYERLLIVGESPFDRFASDLAAGRSDSDAMTPSAKRGLRLFIGRANCRMCHSGPNFSDGGFHNNSLPAVDGSLPDDPGRVRGVELLLSDGFNAAGQFSDDPSGPIAQRLRFVKRSMEMWGEFKTPSLRNVALTPPYMHQGQFPSLEEVVRFYSTLQGQVRLNHHQETVLVPLNLTDAEVADLVEFLQSLTGDVKDESLLSAPDSMQAVKREQ